MVTQNKFKLKRICQIVDDPQFAKVDLYIENKLALNNFDILAPIIINTNHEFNIISIKIPIDTIFEISNNRHPNHKELFEVDLIEPASSILNFFPCYVKKDNFEAV